MHCSHINPCKLKSVPVEEWGNVPPPPPVEVKRPLPPPDIIRDLPPPLSSYAKAETAPEPRRSSRPASRSDDSPLAYVTTTLAAFEATLSVFNDEIGRAPATQERGSLLIEIAQAMDLVRKISSACQALSVRFEKIRMTSKMLPGEEP